MNRYLWILLAGSVSTKAFAQSDVATSTWKPQPVAIDGKLTEWNQPLRFYDADTQLFFDIANDSSNIYICFESKDEMTQTKLMRAGMKMTLSTKGKPKHEASVEYPLSPKLSAQKTGQLKEKTQDDNGNQNDPAMRNRNTWHQHYIQTHSTMEAEGFATAKGEMPLLNPSGIVAAINWDTAYNLGYEIAIPKKEFFGADYNAKDVSSPDITLSVEINALPGSDDDKKSHDHSNGNDNGEEPEDRRGQFNGGGYNNGNEGGRQQWSGNTDVSLHSKSSFKQKFALSKSDK